MLPVESTNKIIQTTGSWTSASAHLQKAVGSIKLGARLFGIYLKDVLAELVQKTMETPMDKIFADNGMVTMAKFVAAKKAALVGAEAIEKALEHSPPRASSLDIGETEAPQKSRHPSRNVHKHECRHHHKHRHSMATNTNVNMCFAPRATRFKCMSSACALRTRTLFCVGGWVRGWASYST